MIKIGLVSAALPQYDFSQLVDCVSAAGLDSVEVMCWPTGNATRKYSGVTHIDARQLNAGRIEEIHELCQSRGITISALGYYPNPLSGDSHEADVAVEHLKILIPAAKALGVPMVNTFVGRDKTRTVEANLERFLPVWAPIIEKAEQYRIKLAVENCPMYFTQDEWPGGCNLATAPYIWDELFRRIDSPWFGLNYDPSHMVLMDMDYLQPLTDYSRKIFHLHLKDLRIDRQRLNRFGRFAYPLQYMEPKIPGRGEIDWTAFFGVLESIGYNGSASLELEDRDFEGTTRDILQAITLSVAAIRNAMSRLGRD